MKKVFTQTLMGLRGGTVVKVVTHELDTLAAMARDTATKILLGSRR
ncbi:hypothetical protein [Paraburkholderia sp. BCC1884]|nr:hypothetical protein [Paraburkholderia sp. BCC1884]